MAAEESRYTEVRKCMGDDLPENRTEPEKRGKKELGRGVVELYKAAVSVRWGCVQAAVVQRTAESCWGVQSRLSFSVAELKLTFWACSTQRANPFRIRVHQMGAPLGECWLPAALSPPLRPAAASICGYIWAAPWASKLGQLLKEQLGRLFFAAAATGEDRL